MRTATVRELRNRYLEVLGWVEAGEEVAISRRGVVVARLVPEMPDLSKKVDWTTSAAFRMDRSQLPVITAEQKAELLDYNKGSW